MELNRQILPRFLFPNEDWGSAVQRVAQLGTNPFDRRCLESAINKGEFIPAGQIWRGAGRAHAILYNCFVSPVESDEPATEIAKRVTAWTRSGCGVGVNVSDWCRKAGNESGEMFHEIVGAIAASQQLLWETGQRRTATMINVDWETNGIDLMCLRLSQDPMYRHLNLGVLVPDSVMADASVSIATRGECHSLDRLASFATLAWQTGNPGLLFQDRVNRDHPYSEVINACNPCAEQHLAPNEGCNLGSINLAAHVSDGAIEWDKLDATIRLGVRFLDCIIDQTSFPNTQAAILASRRRRIGLGVTGFGTMLAHLKIEYDSEQAKQIAGELAKTLSRTALVESANLTVQHGACQLESDTTEPRRNSYLLSIAPAGAISLLWNVSSGIEPIFSSRYRKGDFEIDAGVFNRQVRTALDVSSDAHVRMLATWQEFVDGGVSKTVNLPFTATPDDILRVFVYSWRLQTKGVSVFREGSRPASLIPLPLDSRSTLICEPERRHDR